MSVGSVLLKINELILNPIIILLFFIASAFFIWGIIQFITSAETDEGRAKGKRNIVYGIIGIFIMISVFGILQLIVTTFGLQGPEGGSPLQDFVQ